MSEPNKVTYKLELMVKSGFFTHRQKTSASNSDPSVLQMIIDKYEDHPPKDQGKRNYFPTI
jgi:hypothetical protein